MGENVVCLSNKKKYLPWSMNVIYTILVDGKGMFPLWVEVHHSCMSLGHHIDFISDISEKNRIL